jgi:hypothetical protein
MRFVIWIVSLVVFWVVNWLVIWAAIWYCHWRWKGRYRFSLLIELYFHWSLSSHFKFSGLKYAVTTSRLVDIFWPAHPLEETASRDFDPRFFRQSITPRPQSCPKLFSNSVSSVKFGPTLGQNFVLGSPVFLILFDRYYCNLVPRYAV